MLCVLASYVLPLSAANFSNMEYPAFVKFYAPWCGHCKQLAPVYATFAEQVDYAVYEVDCTVETEICTYYSVSGFPTVKFYYAGEVYNFDGERTVEALTGFANRMMQPALLSQQQCISGVPCFTIYTEDAAADEAYFSFVKQGYNYVVKHGAFKVLVAVDGEEFTTTDKASVQQFFQQYRNGFFPDFSLDLFEEQALYKKQVAVVVMNESDERYPFIDALKHRKTGIAVMRMLASYWEQFIELFNITQTPHALVLDFTSSERFYSGAITDASELLGFIADVYAGKIPEYHIAAPGGAERKTSSIILAVAVGIVVFGGIAFALRCLKGQAASEVNVERAERPIEVKEVSEAVAETQKAPDTDKKND